VTERKSLRSKAAFGQETEEGKLHEITMSQRMKETLVEYLEAFSSARIVESQH
jgi:hypothetical protein